MSEDPGEDAPLQAKIIYRIHKSPTHINQLTEELNRRVSTISDAVHRLEALGLVSLGGVPQSKQGGLQLRRTIEWNPEVDVRIATQPVITAGEKVLLHISWPRDGRGSVYSKHLVCLTEDSTEPKRKYNF